MAEQTDDLIIKKWNELLKSFYGIIEGNPTVDKVKVQLIELQQKASNSKLLTQRQSAGIYDRCKFYLNGTYGKNLSHLAN